MSLRHMAPVDRLKIFAPTSGRPKAKPDIHPTKWALSAQDTRAAAPCFQFALSTSTPKTYVGPNIFDRKMTILLSGVKLTFGSSV
jgi:hypothetical protein